MEKYKSWNFKTNEWYVPDHDTPPTLIGNTGDLINWDKVITDLDGKTGMTLPWTDWDNPLFLPMRNLFIDSNYSKFGANWVNYYPGVDYDPNIDELFGKFVGSPRCIRAWISKVLPGCSAPWHWDLDDNEPEYIKHGDLVRYSCRISEPSVGHVTVVGNHALYSGSCGDVYKWTDPHCWHGSINCGLTPKYQYNYLAYI